MTTTYIDVAPINANFGQQVDITIPWTNSDNTAANLMGRTVQKFAVSPEIDGNLSVQIVNAAAGLVGVTITWNDAFERGKAYYFQVRVLTGLVPIASNTFELKYQ